MTISATALQRMDDVLDVLSQITMVDLPDLLEDETTVMDLRRYSELSRAVEVHAGHIATQVLIAALGRLPE